jgi:hypothetical protein
MVHPTQPDLFLPDAEADLFGPDYAPPVYYPDPDRVRGRLQKILAELRGAAPHGLKRSSAEFYQLIFPQMSKCLPEDEAAQLCFEFETEMARLKAA